MNSVNINSSLFGYMGRIGSGVLQLLLIAAIIGGIAIFEWHVYEWTMSEEYTSNYYILPGRFFLGIAVGSAIQLILMILFCFKVPDIIECFYDSKTEVAISDSGEMKKIEYVKYSFPSTISRSFITFNRITGVEVEQSLFGRRTDTGDLLITTITYTNADAIQTDYRINGIKAPYAKKNEVNQFVTPHDSIRVKFGE